MSVGASGARPGRTPFGPGREIVAVVYDRRLALLEHRFSAANEEDSAG